MALTQISTGMLASGDGTVDLNIDNGTFVVDVSTSRVGIGTASPRSILDLDGGSETQLRLQTTNSGSAANDGLLISLDSSTNAKAYIWNYENAETIFGTNNTERMRIFSDGDVSIGMTANYAKLNVNGDVRAENSKFLAGREDAANPAFAFHDDSDTGIFNINPNILGFSAAGTERMRIDGATGRVGIGAVAPTDGTLHVQTASAGTVAASTQADDIVIENSAEGGMTIITPDDQSARIRFTSPSTNNDVGGAHIFYRQNINKMNIGTNVSGGTMSILSGAGNETMVLDASGNVGIGNSSPSSYFSNASNLVVGAATGANGITISGSTDTQIFFADGTSGADAYRGVIRYSHADNGFSFWTDATQRMQIDSSGNVQIGTPLATHVGTSQLFINRGVNAAAATSGTTQTGGALRLRGADNAVLDMGLNSVYTWIQATDRANLANGYPLTLNPNGGNVGIGNMLAGAPLHVDPAANVTTGFGAPLIKVGGDNSWAGNGSLYSVGFGYVDNSITNKSPVEIGIKTTTNAGYTRGDLVFATRASTNNVAPAERMRIHSSGDMIYGGGSTGVHEKHFFGITTGNAAVSHDITHTSDTSTGTVLHIQAAFTHHPSYDCVLETWVSRRGSTFSHAEQFRRNTSVSGSWTVSYVSSTVTRVTKNAGTYVGGGPYWIKAVWKNYD